MNGLNPEILFLSGIRWEFSRQRHQELAVRFSRHRRVLFVEMGFSPFNFLRERRVTVGHWRDWLRGVRPLGENLFLAAPPPLLPLGRSLETPHRINQLLLRWGAAGARGRLGMKNHLVWISDPCFSGFARNRGQALTVFDWIHDHSAEAPGRLLRVYRRSLEETLEHADLVFTPSRTLLEREGRNDPRFHYLPHGAEPPPEDPGPIPADLSALPAPVIGFIGTIGPAFDPGLVEFLAERRKDWSLALVGEVRGEVGRLRSLDNVFFLGRKKPEDLPRYLRGFSAGIIPYRVGPSTENVHPVKTYEYLAAGLPVVSTRLSELEGLKDMVELAGGREEFLDRLERALAGDGPEERRRRRGFARLNSWDARAEEADGIIRKALAGKGAGR